MTFAQAIEAVQVSAAASNAAARAADWFPEATPRDTVGRARREAARTRQMQVAELRGQGMKVTQIAERLGVSQNTVKSDLCALRGTACAST